MLLPGASDGPGEAREAGEAGEAGEAAFHPAAFGARSADPTELTAVTSQALFSSLFIVDCALL